MLVVNVVKIKLLKMVFALFMKRQKKEMMVRWFNVEKEKQMAQDAKCKQVTNQIIVTTTIR